MSARISKHSKERIIERTDGVETKAEAKRMAKTAWTAGKSINSYQVYPEFFAYLQKKKSQSNTCSVRVYKGNIYIWRGARRTLLTAHPIPNRYLKEMNEKC